MKPVFSDRITKYASQTFLYKNSTSARILPELFWAFPVGIAHVLCELDFLLPNDICLFPRLFFFLSGRGNPPLDCKSLKSGTAFCLILYLYKCNPAPGTPQVPVEHLLKKRVSEQGRMTGLSEGPSDADASCPHPGLAAPSSLVPETALMPDARTPILTLVCPLA